MVLQPFLEPVLLPFVCTPPSLVNSLHEYRLCNLHHLVQAQAENNDQDVDDAQKTPEVGRDAPGIGRS